MKNELVKSEIIESLLPFSQRLGYSFKNSDHLLQALTHKSFYNENVETLSGDNECLELLGDSAIDLFITSFLIEKYPKKTEGELSQMRAFLVKEETLSQLANTCQLGEYLLLSKGEHAAGGAEKPRLLASGLEAIIGAIFLDSGYDVCREVGLSVFAPALENIVDAETIDHKTQLQIRIQEKHHETPSYKLEKSEGPDHNKEFYVSVWMNEKKLALGQGRSKKIAEQKAAEKALCEWRAEDV